MMQNPRISISRPFEQKESFRLGMSSQSIQGDGIIYEVYGLKYNFGKIAISIVLGIFTFGMGFLIIFWFMKIRLLALYDFTEINSATHFLLYNWDYKWTIVPNFQVEVPFSEPTFISSHGFQSRYHYYYFDQVKKTFQTIIYDTKKKLLEIQKQTLIIAHSYDLETAAQLQQAFGSCQIDIPVPSKVFLFFKEIINPFFVFQIFSTLLWIYEDYVTFAVIILVTTIAAAVINLITLTRNFINIRNMALYQTNVDVLRKETGVKQVSSVQLVPGDIIFIKDSFKLPCDCILLEGSALINQSILTGESVPVVRSGIDQISIQDENTYKKFTLFQGTLVIQTNIPSVHLVQQQGGNEEEEEKEKEKKDDINQEIFDYFKNKALIEQEKFLYKQEQLGLAALVVRTGFSTARGQLIRNILYPVPNRFKFFEESVKFLGLLGVLAIIGFILSFPILKQIMTHHDLFIQFLDLFTITVPPALPAALQVGIEFAMVRLQSQNIRCISPQKIVVGGRVDTVCFDKTGTLTQDKMQIIGVIPKYKAELSMNIINPIEFEDFQEKNKQSLDLVDLTDCMAVCHSLSLLRKQQTILGDDIIGDTMEQQLFNMIQAQLTTEQSKGGLEMIIKFNNNEKDQQRQKIEGRDELAILKRFQFASEVQRMSVLVKKNESQMILFTQGAPEVIKEICTKESIPRNYSQYIEYYSNKGYRILAFAVKDMGDLNYSSISSYTYWWNQNVDSNNQQRVQHQYKDFSQVSLNDREISFMNRPDAEKNLIFVGLVIFENPLQSESAATVQTLNQARMDTKIVTGDNVLTAASVGIQCNFIKEDGDIVICDFNRKQDCVSFLKYSQQQYISPNFYQDDKSKTGLQNSSIIELNDVKKNERKQSGSIDDQRLNQTDIKNFSSEFERYKIFSVCMTGHLFEQLYMSDKNIVTPDILEILKYVQIFARMKPNHQKTLIQLLQDLNQTVGMVGDGANDCGALQQADVGLSLSQAESSISAPFTSQDLSVKSIIDLLIHCRAGLVISFQCFKFLALYCIIQFVCITYLYMTYSILSMTEFCFQDIVTISLCFAMSLTDPVDFLHYQLPSDKLLNLRCLISIFSQMFFAILSQFYISKQLRTQDFYSGIQQNIRDYYETDWLSVSSQDTSTLFIFSNFMIIGSNLAILIGFPFQKEFVTNRVFVAILIILWVYCISFPFIKVLALPGFEINQTLSHDWTFNLIALGHAYILFIYLYEKWVIPWFCQFFE